MQHPGEGVGPEACAKTAQTSTCIHTKRRVALYRFGHSSVPCRQRPIPHPAGPSIADFEETQPSHMQAQWSPRKPIGRTPNVILAKSRAHQEAARRSIKNSTISDSIVRGRALSRCRLIQPDSGPQIDTLGGGGSAGYGHGDRGQGRPGDTPRSAQPAGGGLQRARKEHAGFPSILRKAVRRAQCAQQDPEACCLLQPRSAHYSGTSGGRSRIQTMASRACRACRSPPRSGAGGPGSKPGMSRMATPSQRLVSRNFIPDAHNTYFLCCRGTGIILLGSRPSR